MLFIFHAKLNRGVQTYFSVKQRQKFAIKMEEISFQISAAVFTLAKSYGSYFHISILNTVCLRKCSLVGVIAECHYVNLLIVSLLWSRHI